MKVGALSVEQLNALVARAISRSREHLVHECEDAFYSYCMICEANNHDWNLEDTPCDRDPPFCTDWTFGGPLIASAEIDLYHVERGSPIGWEAEIQISSRKRAKAKGAEPLIAAVRAFIVSRYGEEVPEK